MSVVRVRKLTLMDGTNPFYLDGRLLQTGVPYTATLNQGRNIGQHGMQFQNRVPRQFSITLTGIIYEDKTRYVRRVVDQLEQYLGLRNRRLYINQDRFWIVRNEGIRGVHTYPGVRKLFISMEVFLRVMDPLLHEDDLTTLRRSW